MVATTNAVAKIAAVVAGLGLVAMSFASFAPAAKAMTADEIAAQIAALQAQLASLGGSSSASATFTMDLTLGSSGAEVTALQNWLISKGYSIPAGATGYFGAQTQAALAAYQAANGISPAAGYFGPITRAKVNAAGGSTGSTGGSTSGDSDLSGGAGSIDSFDEISGFSNEEVGEDEEDVEVGGIEIENGDGSDIELTAVRIDFATQPGNDDLDEFITEVSIWLDGEEVARLDAEDFNDDNDWTRTVSLDSGAIIRSDDTAELTVAVSGVSNIDSDDAGDDWGLDFVSVRYVDAQGASITDNTNTDPFTWDVNTFASAADVELKASIADESPEGGVINIDDTDDTDGVELLRFTLEAEGSDIEIKDLPITFTAGGTTADDVDDILNTVYLTIGDDEFSENVSTAAATASVTFDDIDFTVEEGDEVEVVVTADLNDSEAGVYVDGDTILASYTASNRASVDAEDATGEDLADSDKTGTASGETMALYDVGIMVTFVSATETVNASDGNDNDSGQFVIKYQVESFDGTVYVSDSVQATEDVGEVGIEETVLSTSAGGVVYVVEEAGTATTADLSTQVTFEDVEGDPTDSGITNGVRLQEGEIAEFTLTVTRNNSGDSSDDGLFRVLLDAIGWATSDTSTLNVYDFNLEDYKTDPTNLN